MLDLFGKIKKFIVHIQFLHVPVKIAEIIVTILQFYQWWQRSYLSSSAMLLLYCSFVGAVLANFDPWGVPIE